MMRTVIAGSRTATKSDTLAAIAACPWPITTVLCGMAQGADTWGERWAKDHGVPVEYYPAKWQTFGKRAGLIRNETMVNHSEAVLAVWDGKSRGTAYTIRMAQAAGRNLFVWRLDRGA